MKREHDEDAGEHEPDYPYGLKLELDHEALKRLGHDELPEAGAEVHVRARAHVTSAEHELVDGEPHQRLHLQITHLGIHHEADGFESEDQGGEKKPAISARRRN